MLLSVERLILAFRNGLFFSTHSAQLGSLNLNSTGISELINLPVNVVLILTNS
jgi:hypothetical protein